MNFKSTFKNLFFLILFFSLFSPFASLSEEVHYDWVHVTPNDYPTVEQFFLSNGCRFAFTVSHFYDADNEKWLSHSQVAESFPKAKGMLAADECQPNISKKNISEVFNIELAELEGTVLIYIGPHEGFMEALFTPGSSYREMFDDQQLLLEKLSHVPRYWVTTPVKGIRTQ